MLTTRSPQREDIERRLTSGESLRRIAKDLGVTFQALQYHRRRWGAEPLRKARTKGVEHASWKGGTFTDRWGYKMVRAAHRDTANPYTHEHILVAETAIGRQLQRGEHVHHINGDKTDNRPDNLFVCSSSRHRQLHRQLEEIGYLLIQRGRIAFDGTGYVLK